MRVLAPAAPKIIPRLLSGENCGWAGLSNCACSVGFASLRNFGQALSRILAFAVVWVAASVHRQPFAPLHLCIDSHLCRCIVQRLCVAVFMHPCITALCGCLYAALHNDFVRPLSCILARPAPCEFAPQHQKIIPRLLSGRKCSGVVESCLLCWFRILAKLWASTITHPCVCGRLGRCIVQRLCATAIVHPLHVYERSVGFASVQSLWAFIL